MNKKKEQVYTKVDKTMQEEVERQILIVLVSCEKFAIQENIITHTCSEMFTDRIMRELYKSIKDLYHKNIPIDVMSAIKNTNNESQKTIILELQKELITSQNYKYYLEKLIKAFISRCYENAKTKEEFEEVVKLEQKYSLESSACHISTNADKLVESYFSKMGTSVLTYYPSIDKWIGSLQGGDLMILAGATSMGKTCMMLNMISRIAKHKRKVLMFSLEMSLEHLQNRIISSSIKINSKKMRSFDMTNDELKQYDSFAKSNELKNMPVYVSTQYRITIDKIRADINEVNPDIVFIDYLGLVSGTGPNSYEKYSDISRELKLLALDVNRPFVVLHQLSRIPVDRKEKRPQLSDLRDSGKIEQDADFVCFVYRESYYNPDTYNKTGMEFIIAKGRHTGSNKGAKLSFNEHTQTITDPLGETEEKYLQEEIPF